MMKKRLLCLLLAAVMCLGIFSACKPKTPDEDPPIDDPDDPSHGDDDPDTPSGGDDVPEDVNIRFYVGDSVEREYIYQDNDSTFDTQNNRFCDGYRYIVYRFPVNSEHLYAEISMSIANQYELSISADGKDYDVLASTLEKNQGAVKVALDVSEYLPESGEGYIYVRMGDADPSDGYGGNIHKDVPVHFFSGMTGLSTPAADIVSKGGAIVYRYDLNPGAEYEGDFIFKDSSSFANLGAKPFRLCDGGRSITYLFRGTIGQIAYVTVDLCHEYKIQVSTDGENYEELVNYTEWGRYRDYRSIDLSVYFAESSSVYLQFSDQSPEDGWGPQIRGMSYTVLTGTDTDAAFMNINDGWTATYDGKSVNYTAGTVLTAKSGTTVTFERDITVPAAYATERAVSFAYIEGVVADTSVTINGEIPEMVSACANGITVALPEGKGGADIYHLVVTTKVGESGQTGLWKNVRLGMADMISYPETSRTLGNVNRPFTYAEEPYDIVKLNALSGNFLQSLYNKKLGINSFDTSMTIQDLYYVGDTTRALIALAYEEIYSPVVRLEYAMGIYETLLSAMVPTSDTHCFLKYDTRPKRVTQSGNALLWQNTQDVIEPFAGMYMLPDDVSEKSVTLTYEKQTEDKDYNGTATAVSKVGNSSVSAQLNWYCGTSDRATTATVKAENCDTYRLVFHFEDFSTLSLKKVAADGEIVAELNGKKVIELDSTYSYFVLDRLDWHTDGVLIATDLLPNAVSLVPSADGSKIASLVLEFDGDEEPTVTAVQLNGIDTNLKYAYYVAEHLTDDFTFGTNGYDPSYVTDHSLGGLAAGAYLMQKYDVDGWEEAVARAKNALKSCDNAITTRSYIPDYWQSAIAGCDFMVRMGEDVATFKSLAAKWADRIVANQAADGSYTWLETRNVVATLTAYDITGNEKYLKSVRRWVEANEYLEDGVIYRGQRYDNLSFTGAGDVILMNRLGYDDALDIVCSIEEGRIDDSGFFACSDLNPYYLGYSLLGAMNVEYDADEKKEQVPLGYYCMYDVDGNYTITDCPNVYVNNPYQ